VNEIKKRFFGLATTLKVSATNFLALKEWHLGELRRARELSDESIRVATELNHAASIASALFFKTVLESRRGDVIATGAAVNALLAVTEEHNLKTYTGPPPDVRDLGSGKQGDPGAGAPGFEEALTSYLAQGNKSGAPPFHGLLAELEAIKPDLDGALATLDAGLAITEKTGEHYTDPYLYRLRGDLLLA
jgi:hypothetical protein